MEVGRVDAPTLLAVPDESLKERGKRITQRHEKLGISASALAKRASIDRATLGRVESGANGVRRMTVTAVEMALDQLEQELGMDDPEPEPKVVRFVVKGVYGAESLVVEGPVENIAELERSVDRIMRRLRDGGDT